jgi:DNA-binding protein H-NS
MSEIDIQDLNLKQLADLRDRIDLRVTEIGQQEKDSFLDMMKKEAASRGLNLEDVLGAKIKAPRKKNPPKFENPDFDPETDKAKEQFWTGHGRKPAWAAAYFEEHGSLDGCLINKPVDVTEDEPDTKAGKKKSGRKAK